MTNQWIVGGWVVLGLWNSCPVQADDGAIFQAASLDFLTQYASNGKILDSSITLSDEQEHTTGVVVANTLSPSLKKSLFLPTTLNPFKDAYAVLYAPTAFKQLQNCSFVGIEFDLDNNHKTKEWYIATSATGCIKEQPYIDGGSSHNWILQQTEKKQFRVLMESDDGLCVDKLNNKQDRYKPLETLHAVMRFKPSSTLGCGEVRVYWVFNLAKNQYQWTKTQIVQANCPINYEHHGDANYQKLISRLKREIEPWVDGTLEKFH